MQKKKKLQKDIYFHSSSLANPYVLLKKNINSSVCVNNEFFLVRIPIVFFDRNEWEIMSLILVQFLFYSMCLIRVGLIKSKLWCLLHDSNDVRAKLLFLLLCEILVGAAFMAYL